MVDKIEKGKVYNCTKTLVTNDGIPKAIKKVYFIKNHSYIAVENDILQGEGALFLIKSAEELKHFEPVPNYGQ